MKFLVTGANGFVGTALCGALMQRQIKVRAASRSQLAIDSATEQTIIDTFDNEHALQDAVKEIDVVVHLAARVHVMHDNAVDPLEAFCKTNVDGTLKLAQFAIAAGVKRFVYVSSIKVNGEATEYAAFNELTLVNPQDAYALSKHRAENALLALAKTSSMEVVIVRPPLVYGENVRANFLSLLKVVYRAYPLPLKAINNKRSMIYLGNLVDALITCATDPKAANQTFLVSDGDDVSTPEVITYLAEALNKPDRLWRASPNVLGFAAKIAGKYPAFQRLNQSLVIDSSKIQCTLNWVPPYTVKQGLQRTADWFIATQKKCL